MVMDDERHLRKCAFMHKASVDTLTDREKKSWN